MVKTKEDDPCDDWTDRHIPKPGKEKYDDEKNKIKQVQPNSQVAYVLTNQALGTSLKRMTSGCVREFVMPT